MTASRRAGAALGLSLLLALTACGGGEEGPATLAPPIGAATTPVANADPATLAATEPAVNPGPPAKDLLPAFSDCAELTAHLRNVAPAHVAVNAPHAEDNAYSGYDRSDLAGRLSATAAASAPVPDPAAFDVAATDGRLLVTAREGRLHVVDVAASAPRLLASLDIPGHGTEWSSLVLAGDRVLVLSPADTGRPEGFGGPQGIEHPPPDHTTDLTLVDLSDPAHPKVLGTEAITGRLMATQRTGDVVRVVLVTDPEHRLAETGNIGVVRNQVFVRNTVAADWLPDRQIRDGAGKILTEGPLLDCASVRRPLTDSGLDMMTILTVDPAGDDAFAAASAVGVLTSGDLVVSSASRMFVATTPGWSAYNAAGAKKSAKARPRTWVHAFDLSSPAGTPYLGSGQIDGYVPGEGALSARGDVLRAVTSVRPPWPGADYARKDILGVAVLRLRGGRVESMGTVQGLGEGRRWKAIRWLDDVVAVATLPKKPSMHFPNEDADPYSIVSLDGPGAPRLVQTLDLDQGTADLLPVGGGRAIGVGQRSVRGMGERSLEIVSLAPDPSGALRQTQAVSYGQADTWGAAPGFTWLPGPRLLVLQGSMRAASMGCHGPVPCLANPGGFDAGAVSLHVAADGRLSASGWYEGLGPVRMLPVGERLAAVGDSVVLLDPATLKASGSVELPARSDLR